MFWILEISLGKLKSINLAIIQKATYLQLLNHNFKLETLGDWDFDSELIFKFRFMHIECLDCKKNIII